MDITHAEEVLTDGACYKEAISWQIGKSDRFTGLFSCIASVLIQCITTTWKHLCFSTKGDESNEKKNDTISFHISICIHK